MYISKRAAIVRNLVVAAVNGSITLVILLIAPLGLAAVIMNTVLITVASLLSAILADRVVIFLSPTAPAETLSSSASYSVQRGERSSEIDRY